MNILVVDDEPLARERLLRLLGRIDPEARVREAENGERALELVADESPDLLLLDIHMPGIDGIAVALELQALDEPPAIIFCTAFDHYVLEALQQQAVAYLLKPVREQELRDAIARAGRVNRLQLAALSMAEGPTERSYISADGRRGMERVPIGEIRCFVAEQKYVRACYAGGELLIPDTLKELEGEFAQRLIRVHRNSLVALEHVRGLHREGSEGWCVELDGVALRPGVSRRHLGEVRKKLRQG